MERGSELLHVLDVQPMAIIIGRWPDVGLVVRSEHHRDVFGIPELGETSAIRVVHVHGLGASRLELDDGLDVPQEKRLCALVAGNFMPARANEPHQYAIGTAQRVVGKNRTRNHRGLQANCELATGQVVRREPGQRDLGGFIGVLLL